MIEMFAEQIPGRSRKTARKQAMASLATMMGTLVLARVPARVEFSDDILAPGRERVLDRPAPVKPTARSVPPKLRHREASTICLSGPFCRSERSLWRGCPHFRNQVARRKPFPKPRKGRQNDLQNRFLEEYMRSIGHFIGGKHVKGTSGRFADVFQPMTGDVQAQVALATKAELRAAVENAKAAQPAWAATNPQRRARVFMKFLELVARDNDAMAEMLAREHGKTFPDAKGDILRGVEVVVRTTSPDASPQASRHDENRVLRAAEITRPSGAFRRPPTRPRAASRHHPCADTMRCSPPVFAATMARRRRTADAPAGNRRADRRASGAALARAPPDVWFTYHVYHKAPDVIGPVVSRALCIPYVAVEASITLRQRDGPWSSGHALAVDAIRGADTIICFNPRDLPEVRRARASSAPVDVLAPFVDVAEFTAGLDTVAAVRATIAACG